MNHGQKLTLRKMGYIFEFSIKKYLYLTNFLNFKQVIIFREVFHTERDCIF